MHSIEGLNWVGNSIAYSARHIFDLVTLDKFVWSVEILTDFSSLQLSTVLLKILISEEASEPHWEYVELIQFTLAFPLIIHVHCSDVSLISACQCLARIWISNTWAWWDEAVVTIDWAATRLTGLLSLGWQQHTGPQLLRNPDSVHFSAPHSHPASLHLQHWQSRLYRHNCHHVLGSSSPMASVCHTSCTGTACIFRQRLDRAGYRPELGWGRDTGGARTWDLSFCLDPENGGSSRLLGHGQWRIVWLRITSDQWPGAILSTS